MPEPYLPMPPEGARYYVSTMVGLPLKGIELYQVNDAGTSELITQLIVRDKASFIKLQQAVISLGHFIHKEAEEAKKLGMDVTQYHAYLNQKQSERLEEEIEEMESKATLAEKERHKFASIALPLFNDLWCANVRGPNHNIKAFGVSTEVYDELLAASESEDMWFKGVPIIRDSKAVGREVIPTYAYGRKSSKLR